ncbi:MAG: hypothetical protein AB7T63_13820 [Planctomycetota bacterium]
MFERSDTTGGRGPRALVRACACAVLGLGLALLTGCGQGLLSGTTDLGSGGQQAGASAEALTIVTSQLPGAQRDVPYPATRIETRGGSGAVTFDLLFGRLPAGLTLTSDGRVIGLPEETGAFPVVVRARSGAEEADRSLVLPVDAFAITATAGLELGEAWSGRLVRLQAVGAIGEVTWDVTHAGTEGTLVPEANGRARYVPGPSPLGGTTDVLRATDTTTGQTAVLDLHVCPDPVAGHIARFGTTDVWYVDFEPKEGVHPFASDWHAALAELGLRGRDSYGTLGRAVDQKADLYVRRTVLERLNRHYLREASGESGATGLAISFPIQRPEQTYTYAAAGRWLGGHASAYSVMALSAIDQTGTLGVAMNDEGNRVHENNSPGGALGPLGVFVNRVVEHVLGTYQLEQRACIVTPLADADLTRLDALLYEGRAIDSRAEDIAYVAWGLARSVAAALAHEIAHSLGVGHTYRTTDGSIMNSWISIHPLTEYAFLPEDILTLRAALPGAGRLGVGLSKSTMAADAEEVGPVGAHLCGVGCALR